MSLGGNPFAESTLAGLLGEQIEGAPIGGAPEVPLVIDPYTVEISGESIKPLINTLSIDVELGRQGTAGFTLVNVNRVPLIGEAVRILFYSEVLFVGAIDRIKVRTNHTETFKTYAIECTDNSYLLFRKVITATYANQTLSAIANSVIATYLSGDGITLGTVDSAVSIPLISGERVSVFDLLKDAATSVGCIFFVDNDKKLNFISTSIEDAPMSLDEDTIEDLSQQFDRETFRNKQTVTVIGTAAAGIEPNTVTYTAQNSYQIPQQAALEGTSGTYSDSESITHPTSNTILDLQKLAVAYAKILLAVRGSIRETISVRTRQYGFRVGQLTSVSLPQLSIDSDWIIQRLSMRDLSGRWLISDMEMSSGSIRRRAQELWLDVVRKGTITALPPTAITTNRTQYTTPGNYSFVVPAGAVLVQVSCFGAGGGGGGGAISTYTFKSTRFVAGGQGGNGGLAVTVLDVVEGQTLSITVPSGGTGGVSDSHVQVTTTAVGTNGTDGGNASVSRGGGTVCLGYGGRGGIGGRANAFTGEAATFAKNADGSGLFGNVVTVGGGASGGNGGNGSPFQHASDGFDGAVWVEW